MFLFLKKYKKDLLFFCILGLIIFITVMFKPVSNYDEIWKYQFSKALTNGYLPYKDINMIITPFYYFFTSLLLCFGNYLLIYRIQIILLWLFTIFIFYKIAKLKNKDCFFIIPYLCICFIFFGKNLYLFDYNTFLLTLVLLITYLRLKIQNKNNKFYFIIGILLALCDLTKQSIGLVIVVINIIFYFIENKKNLKNLLWLFLGVFIPNFIFLVYLIISNSFFDFFDYCLFGLKNFGTLYDDSIIFLLLVCFSFFLMILSFIRNLKSMNRDLFYIIIMDICLFLLGYPIFEIVHLFPFLCYSLIFIFFLEKTNIKDSFFKKYLKVNVIIISFIIFLFQSIVTFTYYKDMSKFSNIKDFSNLYVIEKFDDIYLNAINYAENKYVEDKVILISEINAYISIYKDEYNGIFDLFLEGNLGTKTIDDIFKEYDDNTIFIIAKDYNIMNWQNLKDLTNYFENNFEIIDSYTYNDFTFFLLKKT